MLEDPALARPRLGRGSGGRRPARSLPAVPAARDLRASGRASCSPTAHAYRCYCTPEELEERRQAALARGEAPGTTAGAATLTDEERAAFEAEGRPSVVRFAHARRASGSSTTS